LLEPDRKTIRLRFVDGRPVSHVTTAFLEWVCQQVLSQGQRVLLLTWDNASWHVSKEVRSWLQQHNRRVLAAEGEGKQGVRIIPCWLPIKSPWLNRIEPPWVHGKRAIVEPARLLTAQELESRVCDYFGCPIVDHLTQKVS
jgi:transposase